MRDAAESGLSQWVGQWVQCPPPLWGGEAVVTGVPIGSPGGWVGGVRGVCSMWWVGLLLAVLLPSTSRDLVLGHVWLSK